MIKNKPWLRPPLYTQDPKVTFMLMHVTEKMEVYDWNYWGPVLRFWGVTQAGHSILCQIREFKPYFYVLLPESVIIESIDKFKEILEKKMYDKLSLKSEKQRRYVLNDRGIPIIHSIESVTKTSIMGFTENPQLVYKITFNATGHIYAAKDIFEKELQYETFEANIKFPMRFMTDYHIACCQWVTLENIRYEMGSKCPSSCSISTTITPYQITPIPLTEMSIIAPVRIMAIDIECKKIGRGFVVPELDPVCQIACCTSVYGKKDGHLDAVVFCLIPKGKSVKLPLKNPTVRVLMFESEVELFIAFAVYVREIDPDFFTGYHIDGFDFPYLFTRATVIGADDFFKFLGRDIHKTSWIKKASFKSKAFGASEDYSIQAEGRFAFDMLKYLRRNVKLRSYTLGNVSTEFLKERKVEMAYSLIPEYQEGTDEQRAHLCYYCFVDAELCIRLMDNRMAFVNSVEQSRVTGVPVDFLLSRGAQIKTLSNLIQLTTKKQYIIPTTAKAQNEDKTKGAIVVEPKRGYKKHPVCTLDFASLYPSIMLWRNICYTTIVLRSWAESNLTSNDYHIVPFGAKHVFVKPHIRKGLLPEVLTLLLGQRKIAKADLKVEKDPEKKAVLDGRQLALKIVANSVYGFVKGNVVTNKYIMMAVCGFGRQMLNDTQRIDGTYG